ncbi:MAG: PKD domain-containing protein, partial [Candidatus Poseidoniaceae archaeon]|nr:PKD domain-containing protein [Candidatus Poseidoniaceae archaeon]
PQVEAWQINVDNAEPVANINIESANLWSGELIVINATQSYDLDGIISNYYWQWEDNFGNPMSSEGEIISIITTGTTTISLTVEDDLGSTATATQSIQTTQGPTISALAAQNDDGEVDLNWQWDGEQATFLVLRNSFQIDETNELKFSDSPTVAGSTNYTVIPVIDGQQLVAGSMTISDFEVDTTVESASGLSETGGLYLGVLFLAVSILITALGLLQRRD